eukprot:gb/GECG01015783.1/.p1 GENE.gb/GECG01015783.1/~~gb/GECG01015783.1/.p1  ORF type:complete len:1137 (+),score=180.01 gb/GECG01015783.1/:1-3411(+)
MPQALLDVVEMKKTDPNVYGRVLTLPELPGILPLSKTSVRRDFRGIAGREPQQMSQDDDDENGPQSQQPSEFPQPQIKCDEVGLTAPPSPQAAPTKDEKPATVSSLETAVFRDGESDQMNMDLRAPSKALSGWVAARLISEGSGTAPVIALPGPVDASPLGMGPLRLEMNLRQRIAAVSAKREERDRRFLHLRRKYIHELRNYILENKEQAQAIDELKNTVNSVKNQTQMNGNNGDTLLPRNRDLVSLVMQQNGELRARLSLATGRFSANYVDLLRSMWRRHQPRDVNDQDAMLKEASVATKAVAAQDENVDEDPSGRLNFDLSRGLLFSAGDFVRTAYGDGYVVRQRDEDGMCTVNMTWGAVGYMHCTELTLLCVAGEQYFQKDIFTRCFSRQKLKDTALEGMSVLDGVHSGSSTRQKLNDENKEQSQASKVARKVRQASVYPEDPPEGNDSFSSETPAPVFRSCWRLGVPRGVELKIDPHRSVNTVGYVSGISKPVDEIEKDPIPGVDRNAAGFPLTGRSEGGRRTKSPDRSATNGVADPGAQNNHEDAEPTTDTEMASPSSPHVSDTASNVFSRSELGKYKAEVQRLNFQLRTAEESRREQRKRLTESRLTTSQLLSQLQSTRSKVAKLQEDVLRRESELADVTDQLETCRKRYKEAVARAWLSQHPEMRTKRPEEPSSDDETAESQTSRQQANTQHDAYGEDGQGYGEDGGSSGGSQEEDEDEQAAAAMRGLAWSGNATADNGYDRESAESAVDDESRRNAGRSDEVEADSLAAAPEDVEAVQALAGHLQGGIQARSLADHSNQLGEGSREHQDSESLVNFLNSCETLEFVDARQDTDDIEGLVGNVRMPMSALTSFLAENGFDDVKYSDLVEALNDIGATVDNTPCTRKYKGLDTYAESWAMGIAPQSSVLENEFRTFMERDDDFVLLRTDVPEQVKGKVYMPWSKVSTIASRRSQQLPSREAQRCIFEDIGVSVTPGKRQQFYNGQMIRRDGWLYGVTEYVVYSTEQGYQAVDAASALGLDVDQESLLRSIDSEPQTFTQQQTEARSDTKGRASRRKRGRNSPSEGPTASETGSARSAVESTENLESNGEEESDTSESSSKRRRFAGRTSGPGDSSADSAIRRSRRRSRR